MSTLESGGFKGKVDDVLGGSSPFERLIAGIADFNNIDPNAIDKMYLVANSGLSTIFSQLNHGMSTLESGGFKGKVDDVLGGSSPFERLIAGIADFNNIDPNAIDKMYLVANSGLSTIFSQLSSGVGVLERGSFKDRIMNLIGEQSPFETLIDGLNDFASFDNETINNIQTVSNSLDMLKSLDTELNANPINEYTSAIHDLTEALGNLNNELSNNDSIDLTGSNQTETGQQNQSNSQDQIQKLNTIMTDILAVLLESNNMNKKQLKTTRSMTADLYR
jgi:hypothetical protein